MFFLIYVMPCVGRYPIISLTRPAAGREVEFVLHSIRLFVLNVFSNICHALRRQVSNYFFDATSCRQGSRICITLNQVACFKFFSNICHALRRQVSNYFFDATSCRQGSEVCITLNQIVCFKFFSNVCHTSCR